MSRRRGVAIIKADYREGQRRFAEGASIKDMMELMIQLQVEDENWQPPDDKPDAERPDFEARALSLGIGFAEGVLNAIRSK